MGTITGDLGRLASTAVARAAAVVAGFALTTCAAGAAFAAQDVTLDVEAAPPAMHISGSIDGVRAGAPAARLTLTLTNDAAEPATVSRVTARTVDGACDASYLRVGAWRGSLTVPARGRATVTLPVSVRADLPARCAGAPWGLVYTAH